MLPEVPLTVMPYSPTAGGSEPPEITALTLRRDEPANPVLLTATVEGRIVKLGPLLGPLAVRVTFPVNPPVEVIMTTERPLAPWGRLKKLGWAVIVKSGEETINVTRIVTVWVDVGLAAVTFTL